MDCSLSPPMHLGGTGWCKAVSWCPFQMQASEYFRMYLARLMAQFWVGYQLCH
jgi:hypothetical protein